MATIPTVIPLSGLILRKLKRNDASSIAQYVNDSEIVKYTYNIPHPYSLKDGEEFVARSMKEWRKGTGYVFGIVLKKEVVGICSLMKVNTEHRNAELGYWLGRKFWGQGIMTTAASAVVTFGFEELKLHRILVYHLEENIASKRIIEKFGFVPEGKEREAIYRFGRWHHVCMYGLLEKEWNEKNRH